MNKQSDQYNGCYGASEKKGEPAVRVAAPNPCRGAPGANDDVKQTVQNRNNRNAKQHLLPKDRQAGQDERKRQKKREQNHGNLIEIAPLESAQGNPLHITMISGS
jgi:hypothetical protein